MSARRLVAFASILLSSAAASVHAGEKPFEELRARYKDLPRAVYTIECVEVAKVPALAELEKKLAEMDPSAAKKPERRRWRVEFERGRGFRVVGQTLSEGSRMVLAGQRPDGVIAQCVDHPIDEAFAVPTDHRCVYADDETLTEDGVEKAVPEDLVLHQLLGIRSERNRLTGYRGFEFERTADGWTGSMGREGRGINGRLTLRVGQDGLLTGWQLAGGLGSLGTSTSTYTVVGFERPESLPESTFARPAAAKTLGWNELIDGLEKVERIGYGVEILRREVGEGYTDESRERWRTVFVRGKGFRTELVGGDSARVAYPVTVGVGRAVTYCSQSFSSRTAHDRPHECGRQEAKLGGLIDHVGAYVTDPLLHLLLGIGRHRKGKMLPDGVSLWGHQRWTPAGDGWWQARDTGEEDERYLIRVDENGRIIAFRHEREGGGFRDTIEGRVVGMEDPGEVPAETFQLDPKIHRPK